MYSHGISTSRGERMLAEIEVPGEKKVVRILGRSSKLDRSCTFVARGHSRTEG